MRAHGHLWWAFELRCLQTLVEIGAESNTTVVFPLPIDMMSSLTRVFENLAGPAKPADTL
jgi:hypothetical protein